MSKSTLISLVALIASFAAYGIKDIQTKTRYEEKVKSVCADVAMLKKNGSTIPVLENRVTHLEDNTNRLITKMDHLIEIFTDKEK